MLPESNGSDGAHAEGKAIAGEEFQVFLHRLQRPTVRCLSIGLAGQPFIDTGEQTRRVVILRALLTRLLNQMRCLLKFALCKTTSSVEQVRFE